MNGDLQWCLELLRRGGIIGKHMARFDDQVGRYRVVVAKEYLVVDCRGPKRGSGVQPDESRCTLYFSEDFSVCICRIANEARD